tara:strand:- start:1204 stop:2538 length:1335 start_codon:yes stop_codon:yes gene_type:complete
MEKKIFIKTFGCQMNEYDSNRIFDIVKKIGLSKTSNQSDADCYLINTCHIRDKAKEKVYHEVGRVKKIFRNKKKPLFIVAGCVAQAENEEMLKREPYIDMIIGPQSYHQINSLISNFKKNCEEVTEFEAEDKFNYLDKIKNTSSKVSSFLTIQEGCDKFCSFCVVPYTRGPEYSRSFEKIILEAQDLVENGAKEIILLGQNVNAYSFKGKLKEYKLSDLISELEKFSEINRIRYTTSHPRDMTDDLIECYSNSKKLQPFVHLPIQSGSNKVLKLMNRGHKVEKYFEIHRKLKEINPAIEFSSDFIIGHPGETEKDFNDTLDFLNKIKFINSYSFIFSPRPGTPAANLNLINHEEAKERLIKVQKILFQYQLEHNKSFLGKKIDVLVENKMKKNQTYFGRNEYFNGVIFDGNEKLVGKTVKIKINKVNQNNLFGRIETKSEMRAA